jgi:hypothetical protein
VGRALWSTTSACASVPGSNRVRPLTPGLPPILAAPCLKKISFYYFLQFILKIFKKM